MALSKSRISDLSHRNSSSRLGISILENVGNPLLMPARILLGPLSRGLLNSRKAGRNMIRKIAGVPASNRKIAVKSGTITVF